MTATADPAPLEVIVGPNPPAETRTASLMENGSIGLRAPSPQYIDGVEYGFASWSDGSTQRVRTLKVPADTSVVAHFIRTPTNTALPVVSGPALEGGTLTGTLGTWSGESPTLSRQWLRCNAAGAGCVPISGATGATYRVGAVDRGHRLRLQVTGRNAAAAVPALSAPTAAVPTPPPVALPDTQAPSLTLSSPKTVRLSHGKLRVKVACPSELCTVSARAVLRIKGRKAMKSGSAKRTLAGGTSATVTIRLSKKLQRAVKRALRTGRSVKVRFDVTASDKASNRRTRHITRRLRR